jgi:hypothetical protein
MSKKHEIIPAFKPDSYYIDEVYKAIVVDNNALPFGDALNQDYHKDFYTNLVISEDGSYTIGIKTRWQLRQHTLKKTRILFLKHIDLWVKKLVISNTDERMKIDAKATLDNLRKELRELRRLVYVNENREAENPFYKETILFLESEIAYHSQNPIKNKPSPKAKPIYSYKWKGKHSDITKLYHVMLNSFISPSTTEKQFKAVFSGDKIDTITPIKWHEDNASELLYFIIALQSAEKIQHNKSQDYKKMKACFVKPDGTPFLTEFKSLKSNIENSLSNSKQDAINRLINRI